MRKKPQQDKKPFFARFLEKQELEKATAGLPPFVTLKYPSDDDDDGPIA